MRLAVHSAWVVDNLNRLGPGAFYHLSYPTNQVNPDLLKEIRENSLEYGEIGVYHLAADRALKVAEGEVTTIHWYPEFIRVHFMILQVDPIGLNDEIAWHGDYMVLPD